MQGWGATILQIVGRGYGPWAVTPVALLLLLRGGERRGAASEAGVCGRRRSSAEGSRRVLQTRKKGLAGGRGRPTSCCFLPRERRAKARPEGKVKSEKQPPSEAAGSGVPVAPVVTRAAEAAAEEEVVVVALLLLQLQTEPPRRKRCSASQLERLLLVTVAAVVTVTMVMVMVMMMGNIDQTQPLTAGLFHLPSNIPFLLWLLLSEA